MSNLLNDMKGKGQKLLEEANGVAINLYMDLYQLADANRRMGYNYQLLINTCDQLPMNTDVLNYPLGYPLPDKPVLPHWPY